MRRWLLRLFLIAAFVAPSAAPAIEPCIDDIVQTIRARQLLYDDDELRLLNLGVIVENRVATLWGPVPKLDLGLRAESCLRGVVEIRDVRNQLIVRELPLQFSPIRTTNRSNPGMPTEMPPPRMPSERRPTVDSELPTIDIIRR